MDDTDSVLTSACAGKPHIRLELLERLAVLTLRPFENLRVAVSLVERRQAQGHPEQGRGVAGVSD